MHSFISAIALLRAPLLVALVSSALLFIPTQSREIFRAITSETGTIFILELLRAIVAIAVLSLSLLLCSFQLIKVSPPLRGANIKAHKDILESVGLSLPFAPVLAIALGYVDQVPEALTISRSLWTGLVILFFFVAFALLVFLFWWRKSVRQKASEAVVCALKLSLRFVPPSIYSTLAFTVFLVLALVLASVWAPIELSNVLGPVGATAIFFATLTVAAVLCTYAYDKLGIPAIFLLLVIAVVSSLLGTNNNHYVRPEPILASAPEDATTAFKNWLRLRSDLDDYAGRQPYPVYIVTAEGGGLYAAAHTALTLAAIQDACPSFSHHTFAISAVSGGAWGLVCSAPYSMPRTRLQSSGTPYPVDPSRSGRLASRARCVPFSKMTC